MAALVVALHVPGSPLVADGVDEDGRLRPVEEGEEVHAGRAGVEDLGVAHEVPAPLERAGDEGPEAVVAVQDVSDSQHHHA
jgi:hypothetical protein